MSTFSKIIGAAKYTFFLLLLLVLIDTLLLKHLLGFGYSRHYDEEDNKRYPAPFVAFTGRPGVYDHNELGFRGASLAKAQPGDLKIAVFGGSTGYLGDPPIPVIIEQELNKLLGVNVFVANYSVVSSHHRQHLHAILEYVPAYQPDLVVFYGGYNETAGAAYYDPRPGYPYNHFYRAETGPFTKILVENSAIIGEIDKSLGLLTGIRSLREQHAPLSADWNKKTVDKYFETLGLAARFSNAMTSAFCGDTMFMAFFQPYQVSPAFKDPHREIRQRIQNLSYVFDMSEEYDAFGPGIYHDPVHVMQQAKEHMGRQMAVIIADRVAGKNREQECGINKKAANG